MKFEAFNKIPRLSREMVITEKIDGTNAQILIIKTDDVYVESANSTKEVDEFFYNYCLYQNKGICVFAGSRKRWLDTSSKGDNFGFAKWVQRNAEELLKLGEGRHFGEWYGNGIQRGYGLEEKRFALFNVGKWASSKVLIGNVLCERNELKEDDKRIIVPQCCEVVPILYEGLFDTQEIKKQVKILYFSGSKAVPGFMKAEGVVAYHKASRQLFKKTIENDEKPKGK